MNDPPPDYLRPYTRAAQTHGGGFGSLLWASPATQATRFDALLSAVDVRGRTICDVGCGRADLLDHLARRRISVADYIGLEAVDALAEVAERKQRPGVRILRGDFVADPRRLFVGAEVVLFSGSLNTAADGDFYRTLQRAWDATAWVLAFNFLSSPELAGNANLHWRLQGDVLRFAERFAANEIRAIDNYLSGDCTIAMFKPDPHG